MAHAQVFSTSPALLRDEVGGFAVNLVPSDNVQDIYSIVADKVNVQLLKDVQTGTEDEKKGIELCLTSMAQPHPFLLLVFRAYLCIFSS